ncbi:MAG: hypothetical protein AMJ56_04950 [Anaerolineae bacterium SG8_19]|jgi:DUF917 family protein|nr:MAG: hypothetical protein AMJ56_04950 [Anaerolineae bacterium SG8_19]
MPRGKLETIQDCEDFVRGCLFMGTGGGGGVEWGMGMLTKALKDGIALEWVDIADIPDDVWTVTPYGMGSIAPASQETLDEIERVGLEDKFGDRSMEEAVKELEKYLGKPIGCLVAAELGAGNTPAPLVTGARLGIPVVDGDYAGRAIPDEMQGTPYLFGKNSWPFASVDRWGNVAIVTYTVNPHMLERIGKMLAVAAYGNTTMAATPLPATEMKEIFIPGTLTRCLELGRSMRRAGERGEDPIDAAVSFMGGWRLFEGVVTGKDWEDRGGYMFGTIHIAGAGAYEGHTLDVWFKNENHVSWLDGKPWICSPDLVTLAYRDSGDGTSNAKIKEGDQVVAVGMKGLEAFRTEFGLNEAAGPRYFGFDIDYVPIEVLMER